MFLKSVRWRLQIWYGAILTVLVAAFGVTAYEFERSRQMRQIDEELEQRVGFLLRSLVAHHPRGDGPPGGPPPEGERRGLPRDGEQGGPGPAKPGEMALISDGALFDAGNSTKSFYYIIWRRDGPELDRSTNAPTGLTIPGREDTPLLSSIRTRGTVREMYQFTPPGECVMAGRSIEHDLAEMRLMAWWFTGLGGGIVLLGLAGGWWLAGRAIRPIDQISATAGKIATGDLSRRISTEDTDSELGRLVSVLNSTFARLEAAFAQQGRFTSDAAHELRTPIAVMLTQTQTALKRERSAAEYRETVEVCHRAAKRMRKLIELLLALARMDAGEEPMKRRQYDLLQIAQDCVELVRPLGEERGIIVRCEGTPCENFGDPTRLAQVITNLLTNSIHYNKDHGEVLAMVSERDGRAVLTVTDTGIGIGPEDLPHVFERFYRADKSRTGAGGRTGLGLAISKAIIESHGGVIEVTSQVGKGSVFTVRLPKQTVPPTKTTGVQAAVEKRAGE